MMSHMVPESKSKRVNITGLRAALLVTCINLATGNVTPSIAVAEENIVLDVELSPAVQNMINTHCLDCHSSDDASADLDLATLDAQSIHSNAGTAELAAWEKVIKKLRSYQMPPADAAVLDGTTRNLVIQSLQKTLDTIAKVRPVPGRTNTLRRLTRFEYENAIRDLLSLDVDVTEMLPTDPLSHGFDNITTTELSPTLINRYVSAAQKISRLAVGRTLPQPDSRTFRVRPDVTQEQHQDGLPIGTRGGTLISHTFPQDGQYEVTIRLTRDRNEHVEGLSEPHELEILLDSQRMKLFTVRPPNGKVDQADEYDQPTHANVDRHLRTRIDVTAGQHEIGVTFLKKASSLLESKRQPLHVHFNMYRHPRLSPAIYQVSITGPFDARGATEMPSRRRILFRLPANPDDESSCAREIISTLVRRAYRRSIGEDDLTAPLVLYQQGHSQGGFEAGIEMALSGILVNPNFLFRIERDPDNVAAKTAYNINDHELASRLSFFLWSSIPDDELLDLADQQRLNDSVVLERQTRRMLADQRADTLVENFASQWLYLRNLDSLTPDSRLFPDFDDNLRQALRRETELFFTDVVREDRSVLELLKANQTFLNERLAKHYKIPHVYGSRFRKVSLDTNSQRGGLLRHGSILMVTSYATRTSPVLRGNWILENILGTPTPPPPPNVPTLVEASVSADLPIRDRLVRHRADPNCASCHNLIDPCGFALENFDAVGQWREFVNGKPIDSSGGLPGGRRFSGVAALEQGLLEQPELFVGTLAEKLLVYALGRGLDHYDAPAIRKIVRHSKEHDFRFSSLILEIVKSTPFQMRTSE
jgi:hypothetical protein